MKKLYLIQTLRIFPFLIMSSLFGQVHVVEDMKLAEPTHVTCEYDRYKQPLDAYYSSMEKKNQNRFQTRSNNGNLELHIYVDTSYERRRTGGYNNNDSVRNYLNGVFTDAQILFNNASASWDVVTEAEIVFFDGATPFSYGADIAASLINFYDWVDAQGYPGNDDNYIFYTGNYTNRGVSFLGTLCLPGGSLVGFVNSKNPNVDLSSHEWIGHSASSNHYNTEVNIMNSNTSRPWNNPSIVVIQDFLDNQTCVANFQPPMAFGFIHFDAHLNNTTVDLNWSLNAQLDVKKMIIERSTTTTDWVQLNAIENKQATSTHFFQDQLSQQGKYYYRIKAICKDQTIVESPIQTIAYKNQRTFAIHDLSIFNPEHAMFFIYDLFGRLIHKSNVPEYNLNDLSYSGQVFVQSGEETFHLFTGN